MFSINRYLIIICLTLIVTACTQEEPAPWEGAQLSQPRDQFTVEGLQQNRFQPLMDMSYFARPEWAGEAIHDFSGSISVVDTSLIFQRNREPYTGEDTFPGFTVDFIAHDGTLIPIQNDPIITRYDSNSFWDVIVGAGQVWHEAGDGEWSRASFPLSLIDRYMGQVRNCVATFVFQSDTISNIYVQCSQETADFLDKSGGDIRVMIRDVAYQPLDFPESEQVIIQHQENLARRLPVLPLNTVDEDNQIADYFSRSLITNASTSLGANHVLFLPNNAVVIRFMDEYDLDIDVLVRRVAKQTASCS